MLKERGLEVGAEGEDAGEDGIGELDEDARVEAHSGLGDGAGREELAAEQPKEERRGLLGWFGGGDKRPPARSAQDEGRHSRAERAAKPRASQGDAEVTQVI